MRYSTPANPFFTPAGSWSRSRPKHFVILVIRTGGNPFRSRPSHALLFSVCAVVLIGLLTPYSPLAGRLGFTPMPEGFLVFLIVAASTYLLLVEWVKRRLLANLFQ